MARNAWVDNGKYYVGADGKWVKDAHKPGWHKDAKGDWFYYKADGTPAKNQCRRDNLESNKREVTYHTQ